MLKWVYFVDRLKCDLTNANYERKRIDGAFNASFFF